MTRVPLALLFALAVSVAHAAPADAVAICVTDARALPAEKARYTRYFDLTHLDAAGRQLWFNVLSWHVNSLSREPEVIPPRVVAGGAVLAVDLRDYGIDPLVYGRLSLPEAREPYFHVVIEVAEYDQYARANRKVRKTAAAPWLPAAGVGELIERTVSQVPVLRGDWFYYATAVQKDRVAGYYDFLGLGKKEADFLRLIGADAKEAKRLKLEMAASVASSGVAINNRGVTRLQSLTGGYWFTQDYKTSIDRQNVARLLGGDAEPPQGDASEQYGCLPNGLFAYWLQNDKGERQDVVPQNIALDHEATGNDRNIFAGTLSCARCHTTGLQPVNDYARRLYQRAVQLRSVDYDRLRRLRQLYLSDLPGQLADDNVRYARAVKRCNGLEAAENARAVKAAWQQYADDPVTPAVAARELGCAERVLLAKVKEYAAPVPPIDPALAGFAQTPPIPLLIDPVLAGFAQTPPIPLRREHFEEIVPLAYKVLGVVP
jgi:hypothetical protein